MKREGQTYVLAPKDAVGDDYLRILEWSVPEGTLVKKDAVVAIADTSKAAFEIQSQGEGYLFPLVQPGGKVKFGAPVAILCEKNEKPSELLGTEPVKASSTVGNITHKAQEMMDAHKISPEVFAGNSIVRQSDVEEYLKSRATPTKPLPRKFGSEVLSPDENWDALLQGDDFVRLQNLFTGLRKRLKAKFNRHVPAGTLLHDRWDLAREYGFGEGTSVYDECLILGDVSIGKNCWVGPFTILDGNHASLKIGDYSSIGSGSQVYTHNTIDYAITEGKAPLFSAPTVIGRGCFISSLAVIGPGTKIGDHSFVAAGSLVEGTFPPNSYIAGTPARRVGRVEIRNNRVLLLKD